MTYDHGGADSMTHSISAHYQIVRCPSKACVEQAHSDHLIIADVPMDSLETAFEDWCTFGLAKQPIQFQEWRTNDPGRIKNYTLRNIERNSYQATVPFGVSATYIYPKKTTLLCLLRPPLYPSYNCIRSNYIVETRHAKLSFPYALPSTMG